VLFGGGPPPTPEELAAKDRNELENELTVLEEALKKMRPNLAAIGEYRAKEAEVCAFVLCSRICPQITKSH